MPGVKLAILKIQGQEDINCALKEEIYCWTSVLLTWNCKKKNINIFNIH